MSVPPQAAALGGGIPNDEIAGPQSWNPATGDSRMPSEVAEPTQVSEVSQQGATQPGSGSTVDSNEPSFKEKVIGYAKEIRGTTLGKPETKEQGQRILNGEEKFEPKKVGRTSKQDT
ncbi:hypothetical protein BDW22DRAFT_1427125 [Trametopsis cervina]|nr:hypothetical protein BDW22DRAFT_1427125 [Trametopsis cervina]